MSFGIYILTAFSLVFVIEGLLYALFPSGLKKAISIALEMPESQLRIMGASMAALGFLIIWLLGGI